MMDKPINVVTAEQMMFVVIAVLLAGAVAALVAKRLGWPDIVLFLLIGLGLGPDALGVIDLQVGSVLNQFILLFGASYILFDGGLTLRLPVLKKVMVSLILMATVGVVITGLVTGYAAHTMLGLALPVALLLGFTLAPTDPAALVPVFKTVKVRPKVAQTAMSESAFNDATGAIMTLALAGVALGTSEFHLGATVGSVAKESFIGLAVGGVVGYLAAALIGHKDYAFLKDHTPIVTLMLVLGAYLAALSLHGSGFMAVFIAGLMLGNNELFGFSVDHIDEEKLHQYVETTGLIFRMFIFILLGSQVDFAGIGQYLLPGLGVVAVFMLVARPLTVFACTLFDRQAEWTFKERLFLCWTRETGVMPAALAGMLAGWGVPNADVITSVTFVAVLVTILLQATTTRWLAEKLDLLEK